MIFVADGRIRNLLNEIQQLSPANPDSIQAIPKASRGGVTPRAFGQLRKP
jgi:hypothetical protein